MQMVELRGCAARCATVAPPRREPCLLMLLGLRPELGRSPIEIKQCVCGKAEPRHISGGTAANFDLLRLMNWKAVSHQPKTITSDELSSFRPEAFNLKPETLNPKPAWLIADG